MSFTQIYYHVVFSTKNRTPCLPAELRPRIYEYIWSILKNKHCHLYRLNGMEDHLHMLLALHPTVALADLLRDLKSATTRWIHDEHVLPHFPGWQAEYGAFTKSHADRETVIQYIINQQEHHRHVSFMDEFKALLKSEGVAFDERYLQ